MIVSIRKGIRIQRKGTKSVLSYQFRLIGLKQIYLGLSFHLTVMPLALSCIPGHGFLAAIFLQCNCTSWEQEVGTGKRIWPNQYQNSLPQTLISKRMSFSMYLELQHRNMGALGSHLLSALFTKGHRKPVRRNETDTHAQRLDGQNTYCLKCQGVFEHGRELSLFFIFCLMQLLFSYIGNYFC